MLTSLVEITSDKPIGEPLHPAYSFSVKRPLIKGDWVILDGGIGNDKIGNYSYYQAYGTKCASSYGEGRQIIYNSDFKVLDDSLNALNLLLNRKLVIVGKDSWAERNGHKMTVGEEFVITEIPTIKTTNSTCTFGDIEKLSLFYCGIIPEDIKQKKPLDNCTCESRLLFQSGCRCGYFARLKKK